MKTVGEVLSQARKKKKISIRRLSQTTKIKEEFLQAIEKEEWQALPDLAVTQGFVQNFAKSVGVNPSFALAILRRDFPRQEAPPKPFEMSLGRPTLWTPRTTLFVVVAAVILLLGGYLTRQYLIFVAAPPLEVISPSQNQEIAGSQVEVSGKTNPQAAVKVNNQPVLVDEKGYFEASVVVAPGIQNIIVQSLSRSGKTTETVITVKITGG